MNALHTSSRRSWRCLLGTAALFLAGCSEPPTATNDAAEPAASGPAAAAAAEGAPNIVLIFADDLGIGDVGVYGGEVISTPNIDALAATGVRATDGYVTHPTCSPSRAGILTGRYQARHGWEFNPTGGDDQEYGMSTAETTVAEALKSLGYATGIVGKWHLGYRREHHPMSRGFDEYFGYPAGSNIFIDSRTPGTETVGAPLTERSDDFALYRGFERVEVEQYLTDAFTDEAVAFIERHRDDPFFLFLSHATPHAPFQATDRYLEPYRHIEDPKTRVYAAMVGSLDESVARVVAALRDTGQYENTLIAFLSDNGCASYVDGGCSNAPHAGFKRYYHEGGIRVPFILSWPAGLPAGQVYEEPVTALDLLATFTGAAGSPVTTEDSMDLSPYLRGERDGRPHEHLYWRAGPNIAIRDARWKLIRYTRTGLTAGDLNATGRLDAPAGGWSTDAPLGHLTMLYDLDADPGETVNLADQHPDVVEELAARHAEWGATLPTDPPIRPALLSTIAEVHGETVQLIW